MAGFEVTTEAAGQPYVDQGAAAYQSQYRQRRIGSLKATAEDFGYDLIPKSSGA